MKPIHISSITRNLENSVRHTENTLNIRLSQIWRVREWKCVCVCVCVVEESAEKQKSCYLKDNLFSF